RHGGNAPFRPVHPWPADLCRAEEDGYRAAVRAEPVATRLLLKHAQAQNRSEAFQHFEQYSGRYHVLAAPCSADTPIEGPDLVDLYAPGYLRPTALQLNRKAC